MALKIDEKFKNLIPPLTSEEYIGLKNSIMKNGYDPAHPIVVWEDTIIDGHNRYEICKELNIEFKTIAKQFKDRSEIINWIIDNQLNRRNITNEQRIYLIGKRYKAEKQKTVRKFKGRPFGKRQTAKEKIAEDSKVSQKTVERANEYSEAVDIIANNTGINPYEILAGAIKAPRNCIIDLANKPVETQKTVIENVQGKKSPNIKTALKELEPKEEKDESITNPGDLADLLLDLLDDYIPGDNNEKMSFINAAVKIVNQQLKERSA